MTVRTPAYFNWQNITSTNQRVEKPEAYAILFGTKHTCRDGLVGIRNSKKSMHIMHLYGDRNAAVINAGAIDKLDDNKVPVVDVWLPDQIVRDLEANKELLAALPGSTHVFKSWIAKQNVDVKFVTMLFTNPVVRETLKLPALVNFTKEQQTLIDTLNMFRDDFDKLRTSDVVQKIDTMVPAKAIVKFVERLQANKLLSVLDISVVQTLVESNEPELKDKAIKLIKTVIKG